MNIGDPLLNYFALALLFFVVITFFYGIIAMHDIPHLIAKARNHPHQDAIHAAGWVSLFTLHVLWPFLWIWAMTYRPDRGWGFGPVPVVQKASDDAPYAQALDELKLRVVVLEQRIRAGG